VVLLVAIGGSAGALSAYTALLEAMPSDAGMVFVVISHMNPSAHSQLALILSRYTAMPVLVACETMAIRRDHVYVTPPNADLRILGHEFTVVTPRSGGDTQIDLFFRSAAEAMGARAVGIVLSGYRADGTEGCRHLKEHGGTTFAQDTSAEVGEMPASAQAAGYVDFVLPPGKMPEELQRLAAELAARAQNTR